MMALFATVLAMMLAVSPAADPIERHGELAAAITTVVAAEPPLYRDDDARVRTAALVVAIAFRESSLIVDKVGDGGKSVCAMQIYGGPRSLLVDPEACVRVGLAKLRDSISRDREHPVAAYAAGPRYQTERARRISRDRVALAARLARAPMLAELAQQGVVGLQADAP